MSSVTGFFRSAVLFCLLSCSHFLLIFQSSTWPARNHSWDFPYSSWGIQHLPPFSSSAIAANKPQCYTSATANPIYFEFWCWLPVGIRFQTLEIRAFSYGIEVSESTLVFGRRKFICGWSVLLWSTIDPLLFWLVTIFWLPICFRFIWAWYAPHTMPHTSSICL